MRMIRSGLLVAAVLMVVPAFAHAEPPPIFSQEEQCETTRALVDSVRASEPGATPERVAEVFVERMDSMGAYNRVPQAKESDRQITISNIERCGLA
ncbi:hypothetical protein [Nocardia neocaledoniensis]|uniref:hypothetical protein n=1 Tax=Nocardia neocaledoniensis TaxID=236511 RepID=UPI0024573650|nr:hypothetical protein [Nocardia neocaledoniensis]